MHVRSQEAFTINVQIFLPAAVYVIQVNYLFQIADSNHLLETDLDEVRRMFRDRGRSVICDRENAASANYGNDFHLE